MPTRGNTKALEEKSFVGKICANVSIDSASPWTSYRISNVLRRYGTLGANLQHILAPVTQDSISEATTQAANARSLSIIPSKDKTDSPNSLSANWIVRLPEGHNRLPCVHFFSEYRISTGILLRSISTTQYTRC